MPIIDHAPYWTLTRFERVKRTIKKIERAETWARKAIHKRNLATDNQRQEDIRQLLSIASALHIDIRNLPGLESAPDDILPPPQPMKLFDALKQLQALSTSLGIPLHADTQYLLDSVLNDPTFSLRASNTTVGTSICTRCKKHPHGC